MCDLVGQGSFKVLDARPLLSLAIAELNMRATNSSTVGFSTAREPCEVHANQSELPRFGL